MENFPPLNDFSKSFPISRYEQDFFFVDQYFKIDLKKTWKGYALPFQITQAPDASNVMCSFFLMACSIKSAFISICGWILLKKKVHKTMNGATQSKIRWLKSLYTSLYVLKCVLCYMMSLWMLITACASFYFERDT